MTSRRTFLLSCSSVPLACLAGGFALAKPLEKSALPITDPMPLDAELSHADMGIYGWQDPTLDSSHLNLISLTSSWKANWL